MITFGDKEIKEEFCKAEKPIQFFEVDRNNLILSDIVQTKKGFKSFFKYIDGDGIRSISITLLTMIQYLLILREMICWKTLITFGEKLKI